MENLVEDTIENFSAPDNVNPAVNFKAVKIFQVMVLIVIFVGICIMVILSIKI